MEANLFTPSKSEIICGQNVGTKVVCGMILFFEKKAIISELGGVNGDIVCSLRFVHAIS